MLKSKCVENILFFQSIIVYGWVGRVVMKIDEREWMRETNEWVKWVKIYLLLK